MDATLSERIVSCVLIIAIGIPIARWTGRTTLAVLAAAALVAALNIVYWRLRGIPAKEVYFP